MPGLCGIIDADRPVDLATRLTRMTTRMVHHSWYAQDAHVDPEAAIARVSLGSVNTAPQPVTNEDGSILAFMDGEVYDDDAVRRKLQAAGHVLRGASHAELLVHGFEERGPEFFAGLHGSFVAALWDASNHRLLLVSDRFGSKPLYFAMVPGTLLFASEIKALLAEPAVSRQLSFRGFAQFFTFGQFLGEETLWEKIRLLPAAGCLTYDAPTEGLTVSTYWRPGYSASDASTSDTQHLDRIDDAFKKAVDRRVRGTQHLGLSLSGGLDARTILGVLDSDPPLQTITMGIEGSIDHRAAEQLARLAGRSHHSYVLNTEFLGDFENHLRRMVHLTDGQYLSQCIVMPTLPFYRERGIEVLLRGHAGELMHMDKAYNFSLDPAALAIRDGAGLEQWLYRRLTSHMSQDLRDRLFAPAHQEQMESLTRASLQACLRDSEGIDPPAQRIAHLFLGQRVRRETTLSMVKFGSMVETRLPYLDNDLVDALMAAPVRLKLSDRIQGHILARRRPEFLKVVNANTGAPLGAGFLARSFAKLRLKVFAKLGFRGYQPYERLGRWLREDLRPMVQKILVDSPLRERGYFNAATVKSVVEGHLNRGENHTFLLMALMIFEIGQQEFCDGARCAGA
ncbi:MAG TPA: asparagine synthase-related protein, partial [Gemmataceae bacterium]|nr:asparagine synthase-related protein [Gemmataceae bacterium]